MSKNILMLCPFIPYPPDRGDRIRNYNLLKIIAKENIVHLIAFSDRRLRREDMETLKNHFNLEKITVFTKRKASIIASMLLGLSSREPLVVSGYRSRSLKRFIKNLNMETYDLIFVCGMRMAQFINDKDANNCILDLCDALSKNFKEQLGIGIGLTRRAYILLNVNKITRYEVELKEKFPKIIMSSDYDKDWLKLNDRQCSIIRNVIDIGGTARRKQGESKIVIFLGNMKYPPNADAVKLILRDIWPRVIEEDKEASLIIIGNKEKSVSKLIKKAQGVEELGYVEDIRSEMEKAAVLIAPLRVSTGIPYKLLLGISMDIPVVCSSTANKAICASEEHGVFVRDDPKEFAEEILKILRNSGDIKTAGKGRKYIEENFSQRSIENALKSLFEN